VQSAYFVDTHAANNPPIAKTGLPANRFWYNIGKKLESNSAQNWSQKWGQKQNQKWPHLVDF
jgi:hypothetical protein